MSVIRRYVTPLGIVAAAILVYLQNPWFEADASIAPILTIAFWLLAIIVVVALFSDRNMADSTAVEIEGPAFTRYLFSNSRAGLFWLPIRLFIGFQWIEAATHKITGGGWLDGGAALKGFWTAVVAVPQNGRAPISYDWYRDFINTLLANNAAPWFSYLIVFGELAVGVGLLVGCLTGVAAFFGALLNMSFLLAGSASTNPVMFTFAIGLILAWRVAGYYGVDRYLLPRLGVPWTVKIPAAQAGRPAPAGASASQ